MNRKLSRRDFNKLLVSGAAGAAFGIAGFSKPLFAASSRVVIIGGGFGGAAAAKYLRKLDPSISVTLVEPKAVFHTCPISNWVIAGLKTLPDIVQSYAVLKSRYQVNVVVDTAVAINAPAGRVTLKSGKVLHYDRLIVSPGIDFKWEAIPGYSKAVAEKSMPHAFQAGSQTMLLHKQLIAMKDGSNVLVCPPGNPLRCPAAPYERASLIAMYLKKYKPKSKVIILDDKEKFSKQELFMQGWERFYPGKIEWRAATAGGKVEKVDGAAMTVTTEFGDEPGGVINVIPPQKAGAIAFDAALTDATGWCPVNPITFESTVHPGIHVIGDACIAGDMPKSGFAQLKTLVEKVRGEFGSNKTLLFDTGDTWQGSGTAFWSRGTDMVEVANQLGVDVMTGHWEFTYLEKEVRKNLAAFKGDFVAQNVKVKEDALFSGAQAFDESSGHAFRPYVIKELGKHRIAVIGQAFPYTPIANPGRFIPDWTFGINAIELQELVNSVRSKEKPDAVILISHNGMDVDIKLAREVTGIDVIFGGHTHDAVPQPFEVRNKTGRTLVTNAGSNGKFLGVMDLKLGNGGVKEFRYRLLPVFANELAADASMKALIERIRAPHLALLEKPLATAGTLLYRRGNFDGPFDQVICDALRSRNEAQISLSPGFRWGTTVLPGQVITMEHVLDQTCMTYPETYAREMTGLEIKNILEDVADNLFNPDPYYQQGGDMVRVGGMSYRIDPVAVMGRRIDEMRLENGTLVDASKKYRVAGWATVGAQSTGEPIWDTVAAHLQDVRTVEIRKLNVPVLKNAASNPGLDFSVS